MNLNVNATDDVVVDDVLDVVVLVGRNLNATDGVVDDDRGEDVGRTQIDKVHVNVGRSGSRSGQRQRLDVYV